MKKLINTETGLKKALLQVNDEVKKEIFKSLKTKN